MTQSLTVREQLYHAIHGSREFHAKAATAIGELQPDALSDGHREIAGHLKELGTLFAKTAEYVQRGFPAHTVLEFLAKEAPFDPDYQAKLAGLIDETGELALRNHILTTFEKKVREKNARTDPITEKTAREQETPSSRITGAVERLKQLGRYVRP